MPSSSQFRSWSYGRDRWFESDSLQRRVRCERVSRGNSPFYVEKSLFSAGVRAGASGATTACGVMPALKRLKAESGTMVSGEALTAEPVDTGLRPVLASALFTALRAVLLAICAALETAIPLFAGGGLATTVPASGWVPWVP